MYEDGDMKKYHWGSSYVLDTVVLKQPLEEIARREC
jgi:hypothetical protein